MEFLSFNQMFFHGKRIPSRFISTFLRFKHFIIENFVIISYYKDYEYASSRKMCQIFKQNG